MSAAIVTRYHGPTNTKGARVSARMMDARPVPNPEMKIEIRNNETAHGDYTGDVVEIFEGTQAECEAYFAKHYDINDYNYNGGAE